MKTQFTTCFFIVRFVLLRKHCSLSTRNLIMKNAGVTLALAYLLTITEVQTATSWVGLEDGAITLPCEPPSRALQFISAEQTSVSCTPDYYWKTPKGLCDCDKSPSCGDTMEFIGWTCQGGGQPVIEENFSNCMQVLLNRSLHIPSVQLHHSGGYECSRGLSPNEHNLTVAVPPHNVVMTTQPDVSSDIIENTTVSVTCHVDRALPHQDVTLSVVKNDKSYTDNHVYGTQPDNGAYSVTMRTNVTIYKEDHDKNILCFANWKEYTYQSSSKPLSVEYSPRDIYLTASPAPTAPLSENTEVTFTCWVDDARPDPTLTLRQSNTCEGGDTLTRDDRFSISATPSLLPCHNEEEFTCSATGSHVNVPAVKLQYNVLFLCTSLTMTEIEIPVAEGTPVTLPCKAGEANPIATVTWWRDGTSLTEGIQTITKEGEYNAYTVTSSLSWVVAREDNGIIYRCGVLDTSRQEAQTLNVLFPCQALHMNQIELSIDEETPVTLTCTAGEANPTADVKWWREGTSITGGIQNTPQDGDYNAKIVISSLSWMVTRADNGVTYRCDVAGTSLEKTQKLNIHFFCESLTITQMELPVDEETPVTLTCAAGEANPTASVTWWRDGTLLTDGIENTLEEGNFNANKMVSEISWTVDRADNGITYKCQEAASLLQRTQTLNVLFPCNSVSIDQPGRVSEGSSVTLTCTTKVANPTANVTWQRNGTAISEGVYNVIKDGEHNAKKVISSLSWTANRADNNIVYTCEVVGTSLQQTHTLNVLYRHDVTVKVTNNNAAEGSDITLTCEAKGGNPQSVTYHWRFSSKLNDIEEELDCTSNICHLNKVNHMYAGSYTCTGSNGWGGQEGKYTADVDVLYSPVTDMEDITPEKSYTTKDNISLPCHFFSYPTKPHIVWYQQLQGDPDHYVINEDQVTTVANGTDRYTSTLKLYDIKHNMTVTCREEGTVSTVFRIKRQTASDGYEYKIFVSGPVPETSDPSPLPVGAVIGAVLGALVAAAVAVTGIVYYRRRQHIKQNDTSIHGLVNASDYQAENSTNQLPVYAEVQKNSNKGTQPGETVYVNTTFREEGLYENANIGIEQNPQEADLKKELPNVEGLIYAELAMPRYIGRRLPPDKIIRYQPETEYVTIKQVMDMCELRNTENKKATPVPPPRNAHTEETDEEDI